MSMTAIAGPLIEPALAPIGWSRSRVYEPTAVRRSETAGRRFFERFATARQTRIGHEVLMGVERLLARFGRLYARRSAVGQDLPALLVVLEIGQP